MKPEVTIIMVPRERYSAIFSTIDSLYEQTKTPFKFIVVDGGLPEQIFTALEQKSKQLGFEFIHKPYPLNPNEARNIGLAYVETPYLVFTDNDIIFTANWLHKLLTTAKDFDAWLAGPTILDGEPEDGKIHAMAGTSGFEEVDGKRYYHFVPGHVHQNIADIEKPVRGPTSMLEFHVILCATHIFEKIGQLDEKVSSFGDHDDLVMSVKNHNGAVIFEPDSVVAYHDPGTNIAVVEKSDLPFYLLRWGEEWNYGSVDRAAEKWGLASDDRWMPHARNWSDVRRRKAYFIDGIFGRLVGFVMFKISKRLGLWLEKRLYNKYTRALRNLRKKHLGFV